MSCGPEAVHQLVHQDVREERVERDVALIGGARATFEIGTSTLSNLACWLFFSITRLLPFFADHALVVGQVERGGLHAAIGVAGREHGVDHRDRRQRAELRVAVLRIDRQVVLDVLQRAGETSAACRDSVWSFTVMNASNAAL